MRGSFDLVCSRLLKCTVVAGALMLPIPASAQTNVTTYHNDAARTGANLNETVLTTTNVNVSEFGKLFERAVDDEIYAQPLYVEGVNIPVRGVRNVVYVATNSNTVYAFDADDATASAPLWSVNYIDARILRADRFGDRPAAVVVPEPGDAGHPGVAIVPVSNRQESGI